MQRFFVPARAFLARPDFLVLLVLNVVLGLTYSFVAPFMSMFGTLEVGMTPLAFGVFMTVTSLAGIFLSTWLARWSDVRTSRKTMLFWGGVSGSLGYLGYALVRDVYLLTAIGAICLGLSSVTFSQLFAHARDVLSRSDLPEDRTPLYMNVFRLFFALSWTVGPAVAAWVMSIWSFRGTFLVATFFFVLFTLVVAIFVEAVPPSPKAREAAEKMPLSALFRQPMLFAHFVGFVLFFACSTMGMMNLPLLVLGTLGGVEKEVGIVYSVAPVFELPFMFYLGILATRVEHAKIIRGALLLAVVYYGALALVTAPLQVYFLQILSAAIVAVTSGIAITFFQNFLPNQAGTATNVYANASRVGATAGYLLFGAVAAELGHRAVFVVCGGFSSFAFVLLYLFRPDRPRSLPLVA